MKKQLSFIISTLFYIGYFPKAPGTVGSFVSLFLVALINFYFGIIGLLSLIIISFVLAMFSVAEILKYTKHDPSFIVIDELIGQAVTFIFVSNFLINNSNLLIYVLGFIFFRLFDILKPFPVSYADKKIRNAFGVILDDVLAGIYASICLLLIKTILF